MHLIIGCMFQGMVDFLTGPTEKARELRRRFVFKVVPMLNPDGVINGNYRCSLAGCDLNRMWHDPSKKFNPTIFYTKQVRCFQFILFERNYKSIINVCVFFCGLSFWSEWMRIGSSWCSLTSMDTLASITYLYTVCRNHCCLHPTPHRNHTYKWSRMRKRRWPWTSSSRASVPKNVMALRR